MSKRRLRLQTFLLCLMIVLLRGWDRLVRPDLWAEDGAVFVTQALSAGSRSLLDMYAGSYHTLQRLIVLGAIGIFPLAWLPQVICIVYFAIFAWIMSAIVNDDYAWLIPSRAARVMTAVLFCMLPGLTEMMGNLANLNWILFGWLAMVGLKNPTLPITRWELATTLLIIVSIATTVLLLPLFLWRFAVAIYQRQPRRQWMVGAAHLLALTLVGVIWLVIHPEDRPTPAAHPYGAIAWTYYEHVIKNGLLAPWIGDRLTIWLDQPSLQPLSLAVAVAFLPGAAFLAWRFRRDQRGQALALFVGGVSGWSVIAMLSRLNAFEFLSQPLFPATFLFEMRYAYPMAFAATVFWMAALHPSTLGLNRRSLLVLVFIALNLALALHRFSIPSYGAERLWEEKVPALEQAIETGCPAIVRVEAYPHPWAFVYQSPHPASVCP